MSNPYDAAPDFYDPVYSASSKNYAAESSELIDIIDERNPQATTLLDVACGTGRHISFLRQRFTCTGLDSSEGMLDVARNHLPEIEFLHGDMVDFDLGKTFDVVTCLFSSIGYVRTAERLDAAIASMARHVAPGGMLIVEPWIRPEDWIDGDVVADLIDHDFVKLAHMTKSSRDGDVSFVENHYLAGLPDGIEHRVTRHTLGLFTWERQEEAFAKAGLTATVDPHGIIGRGLIVGQRASA
jgi:ubiquinone/menaquinone biosynthesis C-methylase UbiE